MYKIHYLILFTLPLLFSCNALSLGNSIGSMIAEENQSTRRLVGSTNATYRIFKDENLFLNNETVKASYPKEIKDILKNLDSSGFKVESDNLNRIFATIANQSVLVIKPTIDKHLTFIPIEVLENFLYQELGAQTTYFKANATLDILNELSSTVSVELDKEINKNLFSKEAISKYHKESTKKGLKGLNYSKLERTQLESLIKNLITNSFFNLMNEAELKSTFIKDFLSSRRVDFDQSEETDSLSINSNSITESNKLVIEPEINNKSTSLIVEPPIEQGMNSTIKNLKEAETNPNTIIKETKVDDFKSGLENTIVNNEKNNSTIITSKKLNNLNTKVKISATKKLKSTKKKINKPKIKSSSKVGINNSKQQSSEDKLNLLKAEVKKIKASIINLEKKLK